MTKLGEIIDSFITFINDVLVPLVFALALIVFLVGVFRYFFVGAANPEAQKQGKQLIIYSIIGFAVMVSVWGLVNVVLGTFGLDNSRPCLPTFGSEPGSNCGGSTTAQPTSSGQSTGFKNGFVLPPEVVEQAKKEAGQTGN